VLVAVVALAVVEARPSVKTPTAAVIAKDKVLFECFMKEDDSRIRWIGPLITAV
jgi:hypothetical protein